MAEQIFHQIDEKTSPKKHKNTTSFNKISVYLIGLVICVLAIILGRWGAQLTVRSGEDLPSVTYTQDKDANGKAWGQKNEKLCPDIAEGTMREGGIDGEGTHHLQRKGGKDQNVYLTSSTVDLELVENKKVKVWGKTYAAETAGWLMDVCYLETK